jgi:hypothetical protein
LELFVYVPALKSKKLRTWDKVIFFTMCNALTHPPVFFGFMTAPIPVLSAILWAEAFAVIVEALLIYKFFPAKISIAKIFLISLVANLVSWQLSPILTWLFFKI